MNNLTSLDVEKDTVILFKKGETFLESDAVIEIAKDIKWPYKILTYGRFVPKSWRNQLYRWIARNRYKWFGKKDNCRVPGPEERELFLA